MAELRDLWPNFDSSRLGEITPERGWHLDELRQRLPPEPPGDPLPDGSWELTRELIRDYAFTAGSSLRATFDPDAPLEGRDILLAARFGRLRFFVGVRIIDVVDELRRDNDRSARVWGWRYTTLEGHLEIGQMEYLAWKWLDDGHVELRIEAFSRRAPIANPFVRLGFRLFGRREQMRFYRYVCAYVARATAVSHPGWHLEPPHISGRRPPSAVDSLQSFLGHQLER